MFAIIDGTVIATAFIVFIGCVIADLINQHKYPLD
jgi:hypothetical protein